MVQTTRPVNACSFFRHKRTRKGGIKLDCRLPVPVHLQGVEDCRFGMMEMTSEEGKTSMFGRDKEVHLVVEDRDPHIELDASVPMVHVMVGGAIETGSRSRRRSLIQGETWGWEVQRRLRAVGFPDHRAYGMSSRCTEEGCVVEGPPKPQKVQSMTYFFYFNSLAKWEVLPTKLYTGRILQRSLTQTISRSVIVC